MLALARIPRLASNPLHPDAPRVASRHPLAILVTKLISAVALEKNIDFILQAYYICLQIIQCFRCAIFIMHKDNLIIIPDRGGKKHVSIQLVSLCVPECVFNRISCDFPGIEG